MAGIKYESHFPEAKKAIAEAEENGLIALGMYIQDQAKRNISKERAIDTSYLRNRIDYKVDMTSRSVAVGTNVEYAIYVELGTGIYASGGRGRQTPWAYEYKGIKGAKGWRITRGMKPRYFLTNAFNKNHAEMSNVFTYAYKQKMGEFSSD